MCVVNMGTKTLEMTNAMHFAKKFVAIVAKISKTNCEEIRNAFDQYMSKFSDRNYLETNKQQKQHRPTTMYMVVLKLETSSLFSPTSKQKLKQELKISSQRSLSNITKGNHRKSRLCIIQ